MPGRKVPLITGQIYHVLNRGVADQVTFLNKKDYQRALDSFLFYRHVDTPLRYSYFIRQTKERRLEILQQIEKRAEYLVDILSYCFMPNHFHLLLYQLKDDGISKFISKSVNSYTRYINTKLSRVGPIFLGKFKAVRVETEEQLLHVQRYIHLNPYSGFVIKNLQELENYPYSSLKEYLNITTDKTCNKKLIMSFFKNDIDSFKKFVFDQADYLKRLQQIKHQAIEKWV